MLRAVELSDQITHRAQNWSFIGPITTGIHIWQIGDPSVFQRNHPQSRVRYNDYEALAGVYERNEKGWTAA